MALNGEYEPSPAKWVRDQVELYERTSGAQGNTLRDTGLPVVVFATRGRRSGKVRKTPLMRVEHDGRYAMIASQGGAPTDPTWADNLRADPEAVTVQDGAEVRHGRVRELPPGPERDEWWARASEVYPPYLDYQEKTDRLIPVFVLEPAPVGESSS